jgi:hypothetical protein
MRPDGTAQVSFGSLAPRIDAATWYLLGIALGARANVLDAVPFRESVRAVVRLLGAIEYNGRHLIYVPPGGNWADEYIYEGYILYDQVLRAWGLRLLGELYDERDWLAKAGQIEQTIAERFEPAADAPRRHPIAAFSPLGTRDIFDLAACSLLALSGIAPRLGEGAVAWIDEHFLQRSELPPVFHPVIEEGDPDWPALRRYHLHAFRNRPHEYHNGGIWPIWLGWLALALAQTDRLDSLERLKQTVRARLAASTTFDFEEYLHGRSGAPGGTPKMAYTATGLVFLRLAGSDGQLRLFRR